jgi:hypothetical protein
MDSTASLRLRARPPAGTPDPRVSTMGDRLLTIFEVIDWTQLPSSTQPVARMLTDGLARPEIAKTLGMSAQKVDSLVRELRLAMTEQALEHADELDADLRAHLESLRSFDLSRLSGSWRTSKSRQQP